MILSPISILDQKVQKALEIPSHTHINTWEFYYKQYITALDFLFSIANRKQGLMNSQFMSFMFLLRHSVELLLKYNIYKLNINVDNTHKLSVLANKLHMFLPQDFSQHLILLDFDMEGDKFKYINDHNGNPFFHGEQFEMLSVCDYFIQMSQTVQLDIIPIKNKLDANSKFLRQELTFYSRECRNLASLRTHYDSTISLFMSGIISSSITTKDIYLPVLFMIRHGIELALKGTLLSLGNRLDKKQISKITNTHSINQLYQILENIVNLAVSQIPIAEIKLIIETKEYQKKLNSLQNLIHSIDSNSFAFRFPVNKQGNINSFRPTKKILIDIYNLYQETDPYLTWVVDVLAGDGYLELGDDILHELFD